MLKSSLASLRSHQLYPVVSFIFKFLLTYLVLYGLYLLWIKIQFPSNIALTEWAADQLYYVLNIFDQKVDSVYDPHYPKIHITYGGEGIVSVYQGCSGGNLYIVFLAFMLSFFRISPKVIYFTIGGLLIINVLNVLRLVALFYVSKDLPHLFFFFHKYLFTAILYTLVFLMWYYATKALR